MYGEHDANQAVPTDYPFCRECYASAFNLDLRVLFVGMLARHDLARTPLVGARQSDHHAEAWGAKEALCALFGANRIFVVDRLRPLAAGSTRWRHVAGTMRGFDLFRSRTFGAAISGCEVLFPATLRSRSTRTARWCAPASGQPPRAARAGDPGRRSG